MSEVRILFAEDTAHDVELALRELTHEGLCFAHRLVETRADFLRQLQDFRPDVVITDYSMPAFNGMEALQLSLAEDPERPVILFTGSVNEATAVACLKAGATDYILKEHITRLPFAVREALEQRDIRLARARAEAALRERTEELRRYFDKSNELLGIFDAEGRSRRLNPRWAAFVGRPVEELEQRSALDFIPEEGHQAFRAALERVRSGERLENLVVRVLTARGPRSLEITAGLEDELIYIAAHDVTERLRAEEQLAQAHATYENILDSISEAVYVEDENGVFLHVNQAAVAMYGHPRERFIGETPAFLAAPGLNDLEHMARCIRLAFDGTPQTMEFWGLRADGSVFPKEVSLTSGRWFGRHVLLAVARDISERRKDQAALRESAERLGTLIDCMPDFVCFKDGEGRWLVTNSYGRDLFQLGQSDYVGKTDLDLGGETPPMLPIYQACVQSDEACWSRGAITRGEESMPDRSGEMRHFDVIKVPLFQEDGSRQGLVVVGRDVTVHSRAVDELQASRTRLADISEVLAARSGDYRTNVRDITELAGRLLKGEVALYHRLENGRVMGLGRWQVPADYVDGLELGAPFCSRVFQDGQACFNADLGASPFVDSDPNILQHQLSCSLGHPVYAPGGEVVGSLCVVWRGPHEQGVEDGQVLALLAQALESEEAHRAAAEALRHSEERLRSIFRVAPVGISLTRGRQIHELNEALCRITGYSREELLEQPARLLYPDDLTFTVTGRDMLEQMVTKGSGTVETTWRRKDGRLIRVLISSTPVDATHVEAGVTSAVLDITDRLEAERALRVNEQFMRAVLESSPLGISVRDRDGRLLSHNSAWQRIWAVPEDEIHKDMRRKRSGLELDKRDEYSQPWWNEIQRVYREGGTLFIPEARTLGLRPGSAAWVAQHFYAIPDESGRVDRIVVLTEDISERKRAEEALRESEAHYRRFFENDLTADYISSADGQLLDCNPAYLRLFGFESREQALATNVSVLYPDVQHRQHLLSRMLEVRCLEYEEAELRNLSGDPVHVIMNVLGTYDEQNQLQRMQGYLFDITQYKALQQQFYQAQKMESIGRLAGGVAHDFNNLLTVINGHVDLLRNQFLMGDPVLEQLEQVAAAGARAARLTRQLLAFSRRQVLQLEPVALNEIVTDMNRMLQRLIGEDVQLHTDLMPDLPAVMGDVGQLEQVVVNLAVNSRDAMPEGGRLTVRTALAEVDELFCQAHRPMRPGRFCLLEVGDTGVGMSAEVLGRIFEPFFTTKEKGKGTGLGLATVYGIIKQIGGFVWAESESGQGTVFQIYLPIAAGRVERRTAERGVDAGLRGSETVLVVEDEEMVRRLAVRVLSGHGYHVLEAVDGDQALQLLRARDPDKPVQLVLTDVIMPVMGGRELSERLGALPHPPRVMFMSGYTEESIARHGILEQSVHFIQKPFDINSLLLKVRESLDAT